MSQSEWVRESEWVSQSEWVRVRVSESVSKRVSESEWVSESERVSEWVSQSKWVSEWASQSNWFVSKHFYAVLTLLSAVVCLVLYVFVCFVRSRFEEVQMYTLFQSNLVPVFNASLCLILMCHVVVCEWNSCSLGFLSPLCLHVFMTFGAVCGLCLTWILLDWFLVYTCCLYILLVVCICLVLPPIMCTEESAIVKNLLFDTQL